MRIKYWSHACFELMDGEDILIDPYFSGNTLAPPYEGNPTIILCTHEHFDHCDKKFIERFRNKAELITPPNCGVRWAKVLRIGESTDIRGVKIKMVGASHYQSSYPTGYVIEMKGMRIYHAGDTYLDGIKELGELDIALIPIGGHYTMNIDEAVEALEILKPRVVIPMHYDTFPQIKADPMEFKRKAEERGYTVKVLNFGETTSF